MMETFNLSDKIIYELLTMGPFMVKRWVQSDESARKATLFTLYQPISSFEYLDRIALFHPSLFPSRSNSFRGEKRTHAIMRLLR